MAEKFDVISMGGAAFDIPVRGVPSNVMELSSLSCDIEMATGGDALNGAISMAALGLKTALLAHLGCDDFGDAVAERLVAANVDTSLLVRDPLCDTLLAYLLIEPSGERHILGHGHAKRTRGLNAEMASNEVLSKARHLHFASVNAQKFLDGKPLGEVFGRAKELGLTVSMDAAFDRDGIWLAKSEPALYNCDIFIPSLSEAVPISGGLTEPSDMAEFFKKYGLKIFGCKLGAKGVYICDYEHNREYIEPSLLRGEPIDTTGAGDAFFAGFLAGWLRGWTLEDCLLLGSAESAIIISSVGANTGARDLATALKYAEDSGRPIKSAMGAN